MIGCYCTLPPLEGRSSQGSRPSGQKKLSPLYRKGVWGIGNTLVQKKEDLSIFLFRTPSGARTLDPNIKSVVLYQLS